MGWRNAPWNAILTVVGRLGPRGLIVIGEWSRLEPITFLHFQRLFDNSRTCGVAGWRHRFRSPNNPSTVGTRGKKCSGGGHETKTCSYTPCPPTWGEWGYWGQCSSSCGVGRQIRRRQCEGGSIDIE